MPFALPIQNTCYGISNGVWIDPYEHHPLRENRSYPNFSNPYDENYVPPQNPYPYNPNFNPIYIPNTTGGPKQHQNYPYVANGTHNRHNPEEFANYPDTQHQYNPKGIRPHLNSGDNSFQDRSQICCNFAVYSKTFLA